MKRLFFWKKFNKRQRLYFQLFLAAFLVVAIPLAIATLRTPTKSEASWFDNNYSYRQKVEITNAGTAQTDYQVAITLDTATLITAGKMRSNQYILDI